MIQLLNEIVNRRMVLMVGACLGFVVSVILIILLFSRTSRDERGRAIVGRASLFSTLAFFILVNLLAPVSSAFTDFQYITMANCVQWIYDIILAIQIIAIIILKRIH